MSLDLLRQLLQHVDLTVAALALFEARHDLLGPLAALAAGGALAAGLVLVELEKPEWSDGICWRENRAERTWAKRAMALTMSVLLSMTMTAPVPRPD